MSLDVTTKPRARLNQERLSRNFNSTYIHLYLDFQVLNQKSASFLHHSTTTSYSLCDRTSSLVHAHLTAVAVRNSHEKDVIAHGLTTLGSEAEGSKPPNQYLSTTQLIQQLPEGRQATQFCGQSLVGVSHLRPTLAFARSYRFQVLSHNYIIIHKRPAAHKPTSISGLYTYLPPWLNQTDADPRSTIMSPLTAGPPSTCNLPHRHLPTSSLRLSQACSPRNR